MKKILCAVIFGICISTANAITIIGNGNISCGKYLSDLDEKKVLSVVNASWMSGYMSGLNLGLNSDEKGDYLEGTDANAIWAAVTKYCNDNPLSTLAAACYDAAFQLILKNK